MVDELLQLALSHLTALQVDCKPAAAAIKVHVLHVA